MAFGGGTPMQNQLLIWRVEGLDPEAALLTAMRTLRGVPRHYDARFVRDAWLADLAAALWAERRGMPTWESLDEWAKGISAIEFGIATAAIRGRCGP